MSIIIRNINKFQIFIKQIAQIILKFNKLIIKNQFIKFNMQKTSLLVNVKQQIHYRVFFFSNGRQYSVTLNTQSIIIKQAITQAIELLKKEHNLQMLDKCDLYQLYGARKSGKKIDSLPAFDKLQYLDQTRLKNFYLVLNYNQLPQVKLLSKDSIKSIKTQIDPLFKKKQQIIQTSLTSCFCFKGSS